jgi:hypothetical protein
VTELLEIVSRLEGTGGKLTLDGERIRYSIPCGDTEAQGLLIELRKHRQAVRALLQQRAAERLIWPAASLDAEQRFGQSHAKLFPFIGRKVRTPAGTGILIQVFADRCTVVLDSQVSQCARFRPIEVVPVSWELDE